jgi:hypothetical protein
MDTLKGKKCKLCQKKEGLCHIHSQKASSKKTASKKRSSSPKRLSSPKRSSSSKKEGVDLTDYNAKEFEDASRGKTILMIAGCFCPPHAGHYGFVNSSIVKVKPDIVVIWTMNRNEYPRHGSPLDHTLETWRSWGKIFSRKYGVDIFVTSAPYDIVWGADAKMLIEVEVYEGDMPAGISPNSMTAKSWGDKSMAYFKKMRSREGNYFDFHIKREGNLSATNFTKCLKDLTKDCLEYVPEDLRGEDRVEYVKNIREKYGSELR